jgi:hypothetical protein
VLHGDHDEAVLRRLVGPEEVAEHPLHCFRRLGQEQPRATPCRRTASVASLCIIVERERERERMAASRSGENERRERENGRERTMRE